MGEAFNDLVGEKVVDPNPQPFPLLKSGQCQLPNGCTLYWKDNDVGGRSYYSDEIGCGVSVWDTSVVARSTLLAAIVNEEALLVKEYHQSKQGKPI